MSTHAKISYVKSGIRILGFATLIPGFTSVMPIFAIGVGLLIVAEIIGIVEEIYE